MPRGADTFQWPCGFGVLAATFLAECQGSDALRIERAELQHVVVERTESSGWEAGILSPELTNPQQIRLSSECEVPMICCFPLVAAASSVRRCFRIFLARCHSKCHSLRASPQILLSKRVLNSFAKPYGVHCEQPIVDGWLNAPRVSCGALIRAVGCSGGSAGLLGNAKDCYRGEDLAAMTKAASSASRFSRASVWMENIQGLSTLPHSIPYTGNRSADPWRRRNVTSRIQKRLPSRPASSRIQKRLPSRPSLSSLPRPAM